MPDLGAVLLGPLVGAAEGDGPRDVGGVELLATGEVEALLAGRRRQHPPEPAQPGPEVAAGGGALGARGGQQQGQRGQGEQAGDEGGDAHPQPVEEAEDEDTEDRADGEERPGRAEAGLGRGSRSACPRRGSRSRTGRCATSAPSRWSTSPRVAWNVPPGPPRRGATAAVTGSTLAQPASPALSVMVQVSPSRFRSMAPCWAAQSREATKAWLSTVSVTTYTASAGPTPSGGAYCKGYAGCRSCALCATQRADSAGDRREQQHEDEDRDAVAEDGVPAGAPREGRAGRRGRDRPGPTLTVTGVRGGSWPVVTVKTRAPGWAVYSRRWSPRRPRTPGARAPARGGARSGRTSSIGWSQPPGIRFQ